MTRLFVTSALLVVFGYASALAADETPSAVGTRKKLKTVKVAIDVDNEFLSEVMAEVDEAVDSAGQTKIGWKYDMGVSKNQRLTIKTKKMTVEQALNAICDKQGLGWYVISLKGDRYDGWVLFTMNKKQRGYEKPQKKE